MSWELIIDGAIDGATNMAIDAALLDEVVGSSERRTIVRFYGWRQPTISLGRNQKADNAVDMGYCHTNGIGVVHRPTGGRAVLHDDELTYAVISNDSFYFGDTIYGNYRRVSEALCLGYNDLGIAAKLAPDTRKPDVLDNGIDPPCFLSPSRYELMADGGKITGSAQRRVQRSAFEHAPIPSTCDLANLARATGPTDCASLPVDIDGGGW